MALAFAREGMKVAVLDVDLGAAARVAAEIEALGAQALALDCDVSIRADVRAAADRVFAHFGTVHVLCNNAGVTMFRSVAEMSDDDWDWMLGVNFSALFMAIRHLCRAWWHRRKVATSSTPVQQPGSFPMLSLIIPPTPHQKQQRWRWL